MMHGLWYKLHIWTIGRTCEGRGLWPLAALQLQCSSWVCLKMRYPAGILNSEGLSVLGITFGHPCDTYSTAWSSKRVVQKCDTSASGKKWQLFLQFPKSSRLSWELHMMVQLGLATQERFVCRVHSKGISCGITDVITDFPAWTSCAVAVP